jgi:crotonobetainyl-CoA:carnitine CoA-transferase CaiB-like acyl-CoA transferase
MVGGAVVAPDQRGAPVGCRLPFVYGFCFMPRHRGPSRQGGPELALPGAVAPYLDPFALSHGPLDTGHTESYHTECLSLRIPFVCLKECGAVVTGNSDEASGGGVLPDWSFLAGKRVVDLSRLLPGPFATSLLADLGADVINVEAPGAGDPIRSAGSRLAALNRNKRSVALDLRHESDRAVFLELVATADAVVEGFRPGVMDRLGVGYPVLREVAPKIVMCSISGYGQSGPYAQKPGHELNFLGLSGFFAVPGRVDGVVTRPGIRVGDLVGAMYAAFALTVALASAERSGHGQHVDVSLTEAVTAWCAPFALSLLDLDDPVGDNSMVHGDNDVFATSDGRLLSLATFEDKFWRGFRTGLAVEFPALDTDAYDGRAARTAAKGKVHELLSAVFAARDYDWWEERLSALNAPWAPVLTSPRQLLADPHIAARKMLASVPNADGEGSWPQPRFPVRFGLGLDTFRRAAPGLGEHTDAILAELASLRRHGRQR